MDPFGLFHGHSTVLVRLGWWSLVSDGGGNCYGVDNKVFFFFFLLIFYIYKFKQKIKFMN